MPLALHHAGGAAVRLAPRCAAAASRSRVAPLCALRPRHVVATRAGACRLALRVCAAAGGDGSGSPPENGPELDAFVKRTANTFAPGASKTKKNPAFKGSTLYTIFEVQAYLSILVGGLLAFNVIWPTDEPSIPRLIGMWSVWIFTVPSLRARDCPKKEKDALNVLFLALPLVNVTLPLLYKSFAAAFSADVAVMAALYLQNGVLDGFQETPEELAAAAAAEAAEAAERAEAESRQ